MKRFIVWMEETATKRRLGNQLIKNAGLEPKAFELGQSIPLDLIPSKVLKAAIESLPVNDDEKQKLLNLAQDESGKNKTGGTLNQIVNSIDPLSATQQDKEISQPAILPPGQGNVPPPPNKKNPQGNLPPY